MLITPGRIAVPRTVATMGVAETYEAACAAAGIPAQAGVLAALVGVDARSISTLALRGKGSLRPGLPDMLLTDAVGGHPCSSR